MRACCVLLLLCIIRYTVDRENVKIIWLSCVCRCAAQTPTLDIPALDRSVLNQFEDSSTTIPYHENSLDLVSPELSATSLVLSTRPRQPHQQGSFTRAVTSRCHESRIVVLGKRRLGSGPAAVHHRDCWMLALGAAERYSHQSSLTTDYKSDHLGQTQDISQPLWKQAISNS